MDRETTGTVIAATKQWWLKVNTKPVRRHGTDGAIYPYVIKVVYDAGGTEYVKKKWIGAGKPVPGVGMAVKVVYDDNKPSKAKVL